MLEQKLIVDRFIVMTFNNAAPPPGAAGSFATMPVQDFYLQESTGIFSKTSTVQAGTGPKAHRKFKWLPWVSGRISEVALVGTDVLTGPMSGCWLVTYKKANGVPHAGHLGTDIANVAGTTAVNTTWNNFAVARPGDVIGGFNPLRHWNGAIPTARGDDQTNPRFFGLFTTGNQFHIVVAFQQKANQSKLRIAGIQPAASSTLARLQQVHTAGA
ncbi:MAG TPA: hypothetical protein VJ890_14290 [Vineibacter sp.]|nr:hypothetical protein [Vineibacter sp.]